MPKAMLRSVREGDVVYEALMFVCPGCIREAQHSTGLHMLPVNSTVKSPSWSFDGNVDAPTLSPSILTKTYHGEGEARIDYVCHSFLEAGAFRFLGDCTHEYAGQTVQMPDLPAWVLDERE